MEKIRRLTLIAMLTVVFVSVGINLFADEKKRIVYEIKDRWFVHEDSPVWTSTDSTEGLLPVEINVLYVYHFYGKTRIHNKPPVKTALISKEISKEIQREFLENNLSVKEDKTIDFFVSWWKIIPEVTTTKTVVKFGLRDDLFYQEDFVEPPVTIPSVWLFIFPLGTLILGSFSGIFLIKQFSSFKRVAISLIVRCYGFPIVIFIFHWFGGGFLSWFFILTMICLFIWEGADLRNECLGLSEICGIIIFVVFMVAVSLDYASKELGNTFCIAIFYFIGALLSLLFLRNKRAEYQKKIEEQKKDFVFTGETMSTIE